MPRFSAFTELPALRFSSRPSHGERFYHEIVKSLGGEENYDTDFNSPAMARVYADAMAYGRALYALERATSQIRPARAYELLPALEREYGVVPEPGSTISQRQTEVAVAAIIARGARRSNVEAVLAQLFGNGFVEYITTSVDDAVLSSADPEETGVYDAPGTPRSAFRLIDAIAVTGTPISAQARLVAGLAAAPEAGSRFIIDPGDYGRCEAVSVAGALLVGNDLLLTATFTKAHTQGTVLATGRHPNLATTKRLNLFKMSTAAATDARTRRRLNRAADRLLRGVSTWSIVDDSGPFRVGVGRLGITTVGEIA